MGPMSNSSELLNVTKGMKVRFPPVATTPGNKWRPVKNPSSPHLAMIQLLEISKPSAIINLLVKMMFHFTEAGRVT